MRRLLTILGGIFLVLIIIVAGLFAYVATKGSALDKESKAYADTAIPAIITNWNQGELESRESPEFRSATSPSDMYRLFRTYQTLGQLKSYNGCKGDANISVTTQNGTVITARYIATANFDAGPAQIDLGLIKHGDKWQIMRSTSARGPSCKAVERHCLYRGQ